MVLAESPGICEKLPDSPATGFGKGITPGAVLPGVDGGKFVLGGGLLRAAHLFGLFQLATQSLFANLAFGAAHCATYTCRIQHAPHCV